MKTQLNKLPIGVGILSWRGGETLSHTLTSHQAGGLFDICAQNLIFLPEQRASETEIAQNYSLEIYGSPNNLGILGGFSAIAEKITTPYILILENDFHLLSAPDDTYDALYEAYCLLEAQKCDIVRLRSRTNPGDPFCGAYKYKKYFPDSQSPFWQKLSAALMRRIMPFHSHKTIGMAFYDKKCDIQNLSHIFNFDHIVPITDTRYLPWTNNPVLVRTDFMRRSVLEYAQSRKTKRRVNHFKNIEIELNCAQWRKNNHGIALPQGIFTHHRLGDRGY